MPQTAQRGMDTVGIVVGLLMVLDIYAAASEATSGDWEDRPYNNEAYTASLLCPAGCRCSASPPNYNRHRWNHLLVSYRTRNLYGHHTDFRPTTPPHRPRGRELTCIGHVTLPDSLPSDIYKLTMYGQTGGVTYQHVLTPGDQPSESSRTEGSGYKQMTTIDSKYAFQQPPSFRELTLEGNRIKILHPYDLQKLINLRRLRLPNNRIKMIWGMAFAGLENLEELDLSQNQLSRLPKTVLDELVQLRRVNLRGNSINMMYPKALSKLHKLRQLDLSHNSLKDLDDIFFENNAVLQDLDLSFNNLHIVRPQWFTNLYKLRSLHLEGNQIQDILPGSFKSLPMLKELDVSKNNLKTVSGDMFKGLKYLRDLNIRHNNITKLHSRTFSRLMALQKLNLEGNFIQRVSSEAFKGLINLGRLSLRDNQLTEIRSSDFANLTRLNFLDLSRNRIKIIGSKNFFGMLNLKELRLEENQIATVEAGAFSVSAMSSYSKLTWLYLNNNLLTSLTSEMMSGLSYVKLLNVAHNQIQELHGGTLSSVSRLHTLVFSSNKLSNLTAFTKLDYLQHLDLSRNVLSHLPSNVFRGLHAVEDINLHDNMLMDIHPHAFNNLSRLLSLNLRKNRLMTFNFTIVEKLIKLKYFDLSKNHLSVVNLPREFHHNLVYFNLADNYIRTADKGLLLVMAVRGSLHLYGNPWSCDCHLSWIITDPKFRRIKLSDEEDMECKTPYHLTGERVASLSGNEFECVEDDELLLADEPAVTKSRSCDFLGHIRADELTKHQMNEKKSIVMDWLVSFFDAQKKYICSGVRLDRDWILTSSDCWKRPGVGTVAHVRIGSSHADEDSNTVATRSWLTDIRDVKYYPGSMNIALLKTSRIKESNQTRVFPCLLSRSGVRTVIRERHYGAFPCRATYVDSDSKIKMRVFPFRLRRTSTCARDVLCLQDRGDHLPDDRYDTQGAPLFVKVGISKWALAGLNMNPPKDHAYSVSPVEPAIKWIDSVLD